MGLLLAICFPAIAAGQLLSAMSICWTIGRVDDDGLLGAREGFTKGWHKRMTKALPGAGMLLLRMISAP